MSARYSVPLDEKLKVWMSVEFTTVRREVVDYSVVLLIDDGERVATVRVYDGAHRENELHRYTCRDGKQVAEVFHRGTLGSGMRAAIEEVTHGYRPMIEAWCRR
jgi:hypothetical protein